MFCKKTFLKEVLSEHFFDDKVRLAFENVHNVKLVFLQGTGVYAKKGNFPIISEILSNLLKTHIQHNSFHMLFLHLYLLFLN